MSKSATRISIMVNWVKIVKTKRTELENILELEMGVLSG